jgi:acid phosphatase type 7
MNRYLCALVSITLLTAVALFAFEKRRFPASADISTVVLVGAGDIADCANLSGAEATAKLLEKIPGTVMAVGDLAYPNGTKENFVCYDRTWGREKARTRPAPGNHEFHSSGATPYFEYFGSVAGEAGDGYYSYNLGAWHIIVLNSECVDVGGCGIGSREEKWLRTNLASNSAPCTLAYWHKPLFSSGGAHGNDFEVRPLWQALYDAGADVVINGHDHNYERFAPQDPQGQPDAARGIREFVVGTGGKNLRPFGPTKANSEVRNNEAFGVIKLTLNPTGYEWLFIPQEGKHFIDSGTGTCHKELDLIPAGTPSDKRRSRGALGKVLRCPACELPNT